MKLITTFSEEKKQWEEALDAFPEANFLQSWNWGVFQEKLGKLVVRVLLRNSKNKIVAVSQMVLERAKRGTYFAVAGGPLLDWNNSLLVASVMTELRVIGEKHGAVFIRFRPQVAGTTKVMRQLAALGIKHAPMHVTADLTLELDLSQNQEVLLQQMRKSTRQSIKKATAEHIEVLQSTDPRDIAEFYKHQVSLAEKHGFVPFSYDFLHEQFSVFAADGQAVLLNAYKDTTLLASAFVILYRSQAVYHYGISTEANARLPGSYACQWAAIVAAQKQGMQSYNFWGIAPEHAKNHRFAGVTLFKKGFGGTEMQYLPAQDLILSSWHYYPVYYFELMRKKLRRL